MSFSLGTDTAGSGRVPASFNNLVGIKPSLGLLSTSGVVPACRTLDCVSIFALTCADASAVLDVAAGFDAADPYSRKSAAPGAHDLNSIVIGVPRRDQLEFFGDASAAALFENAVSQITSLGWRVSEIDFQPFLDAARLLYEGPWVAERFIVIEELLKNNPDAVPRQIIEGGGKPNAASAFRAQYRLAELRRAAGKALSGVDAILTPTAGTIYKVAEVEANPVQLNSNLGRYTNFMNLFDLSALAVPAGFLDNGMPWGVTFFAPAHEDRFLGWIGSRFHAARDLVIGKLSQRSSEAALCDMPADTTPKKWMKIAVCGAHMEGLPLNHQLTSRGGRFVSRGKTAPVYKLYLLPGSGTIPERPGLVRVAEGGASLDLEVWELPEESAASFIDAIPAPLGFGRVSLVEGGTVCGFLCESCAIRPENEITQHGGWRSWLAARN